MNIPIYKQLILEKTFNIGQDVDFIFNRFFKDDLVGIQRWLNGGDKHEVTSSESIDSSELSSLHAKKAHKMNPITIYNLFKKGNYYDPRGEFINLSINHNAFGVLQNSHQITDPSGVKMRALNMVGDRARDFLLEFTPTKLKSSIYHELSHWMDDTFHNRHLRDLMNKAESTHDAGYEEQATSIVNYGHKNVGMTPYEIDAQIHAVKQLKRDVGKNVWDQLSFDQMLDMNVAVNSVRKAISDKDRVYWDRKLKSRLHREKLLGKSMR